MTNPGSKPRLGFLGTGWIGRHRMAAIETAGAAYAAAFCDPSDECALEAAKIAPGAARSPSLKAMLALGLDGIVIATPSALHAEQSIAALESGHAVFCQKPLGRDARETAGVIQAARAADRLLGVDFSYRHTAAAKALARLVNTGDLGTIFAIELAFHNAYGPDKPWFYERAQSGGGCLMDLGSHLVDLALWLTGFAPIDHATARLYAGGRATGPGAQAVEDYAEARLDLANGACIRLACSWRLHAGQDAVIEASVYGTEGGASLRNVAGSFYDFELRRFSGTASETLVTPPDEWGGRAAAAWSRQLARDKGFDPAATELTRVAETLDRIYAAAGSRETAPKPRHEHADARPGLPQPQR